MRTGAIFEIVDCDGYTASVFPPVPSREAGLVVMAPDKIAMCYLPLSDIMLEYAGAAKALMIKGKTVIGVTKSDIKLQERGDNDL